jgi:hypothetical protein
MKALSIRQPWAWLIVNGYKDIENRSRQTKFRGRIYIHAGKRFDDNALLWLMDRGLESIKTLIPDRQDIPRGAIVGEVDITDCVTRSSSVWFTGAYGFVLANPRAYDEPTPCRGALGFFNPVFEKA